MGNDAKHPPESARHGSLVYDPLSLTYGPVLYRPYEGDGGKSRRSLKDFVEDVALMRSLTLSILFFGLLILISALVVEAFKQQHAVMIDSISVPDQLRIRGYSDEIVSARIRDAIHAVQVSAGGRFREKLALSSQHDQIEIIIPEIGLSVQSVIRYIAQSFNTDIPRISGEVICMEERCGSDSLVLRLRIDKTTPSVVDVSSTNKSEDEFLLSASRAIMFEVDPYTAALDAYSVGDFQEAAKISRSIIASRHVDRKWAFILLGLLKYDKQDYADASRLFTLSTRVDPDFYVGFYNLGNTHLENRRFHLAVDALERAVELGPTSVSARIALGHALRSQDPDEAVIAYREAIQIDSDDPVAYVALADHMISLLNVSEAIDLYRTAINVDPTFSLAYQRLGSAYTFDKRYRAAIESYRDAIILDADNESLYTALGDTVSRLIRTDTGRSWRSHDATTLFGLGLFLKSRNRFSDALLHFQSAATLQPDRSFALYRLAVAAAEGGDGETAVAAAQAYLEIEAEGPHAGEAADVIARLTRDPASVTVVNDAEDAPPSAGAADPVE